MKESTCLQCGKTYIPVSNSAGMYCSRKCYYDKIHSSKQMIACVWCQKLFIPSHKSGKYCSPYCASLGRRNPESDQRNSTQYIAWKNAVLERDNFTCQRCGSKERLVAHHIKTWEEYPDLRLTVSNGETLCNACHNSHHHKKNGPKLPRRHIGPNKPICVSCGAKTSGRATTCKSCSMKNAWKLRKRHKHLSNN
jgi:5-methylcytosine-specific restriction endonuclease McrA